MNHQDEQQEELQVLESIYPDELELKSSTEFNIHLQLDTQPLKYIALQVKYPEKYPEIAPNLSVQVEDGSFFGESDDEDQDVDSPKGIEFDRSDIEHLQKRIEEVAEENIGMASIFAVASGLKEFAEEILADKEKEKERIVAAKQMEEEEKERKKFIGTPVTPESFAKWRVGFMNEQRSNTEKSVNDTGIGKLTGRQIFEQGLNGEDDEVEQGGVREEELEEKGEV